MDDKLKKIYDMCVDIMAHCYLDRDVEIYLGSGDVNPHEAANVAEEIFSIMGLDATDWLPDCERRQEVLKKEYS